MVQRLTTTKDEYGEPVETWVDAFTLKAEVLPVSGREVIRGEQIDARQRYAVPVQTRRGITPKDRLLWRGKVLEIHAAPEVKKNPRWLELACTMEADA